MKWLWRWLGRKVPNGTGEYREFVEKRLETTRQQTPQMRKYAPHIAKLPADELAERMRRAMIRGQS